MKTIRLLYPDYLSGGLETYYFGAHLLAHILPQNENQPLYKVELAPPDGRERPVTDGVCARDEVTAGIMQAARVIEEAGGAAVAVHGRTREEYYSGKADWEIIRQVKEAVSIPVIGNGDVTSGERALAMREQTGCDGVMIGRGAQGNPWIFRELVEYERTGALPPRPSKQEIKDTMLRHARLQIEFKGNYLGIREMRKHVAWYTKGMAGSAKLRDEINKAESYEELEELLNARIR